MSWVEIDQRQIQNLEELKQFARSLPDVFGSRFCCLIKGELAAGKTEFVGQFCRAIGLEDVASPTYGLHHRYESEGVSVDHFDLYRLKSGADLEGIGFWDIVQQSEKLFIEWPQYFSEGDLRRIHENLFLVTIENLDSVRTLTLYRWN